VRPAAEAAEGHGFGDAYLALTLRRRPGDALRLYDAGALAPEAGVTPVVTNRCAVPRPERRLLQDVVTCIREGTTIDDVGFKRDRHADRHLKAPAEIAPAVRQIPEARGRIGGDRRPLPVLA
jgi:error-prone DNA polymerase